MLHTVLCMNVAMLLLYMNATFLALKFINMDQFNRETCGFK